MIENNKNGHEKPFIEPCNSTCSFCFLNYADVLGKNYLFRGISPSDIGPIIREVHHQVKKFSKNDVVAFSGETYHSLFIIVKGRVVAEISDFEGKTLRMEEISAPDTIATAFVFGDNNTLPVDIISQEETHLLVIPREDLIGVLRKNEKVMHNFLDIMANRAQYLSQRIRLLGFQTIRGKVAHYLLGLVNKHQTLSFYMENTQSEIADMFGVARPSLSRVLRELHNEGIISAKGRHIKILKKPELSGMLR